LEGEATPEGLWLSSTVEGAKRDRFRVVASALGRDSSPNLTALPRAGRVEVAENLARFIRLADEIEREAIDGAWLDAIAAADALFPALDYRVFA